MSMISFPATLLLHGYAGTPTGSVKALFECIARIPAIHKARFGTILAPVLRFSREREGSFKDAAKRKAELIEASVADLGVWIPLLPEGSLIIGVSAGGHCAVRLALGGRPDLHVAVLSAPDRIQGGPLIGALPRLVSIFSSTADQVIIGRTSGWAGMTPHAYDLPMLTHDHEAHLEPVAAAMAAVTYLGRRFITSYPAVLEVRSSRNATPSAVSPHTAVRGAGTAVR